MELNQKSADFGVAEKVTEIQHSIHRLLEKLDQQDKLSWPEMLDSYMVISAQFSSLMKILRATGNERAEDIMPRNISLMPVKLSPEVDPVLQRISEGRVPVWSHAVVPDYLRTKADRDGEQMERQLLDKTPRGTGEQITKSINSLNKLLENIVVAVSDLAKQDQDDEGDLKQGSAMEQVSGFDASAVRGGWRSSDSEKRQTSKPPAKLAIKASHLWKRRLKPRNDLNEDTRTLVRMVTSGKGLEPVQQPLPHPPTSSSAGPVDMMGAAGSPAPGKFPAATPRGQMRTNPYMRPGQPI